MSPNLHKVKSKQMTYIFIWVSKSGKFASTTKILITLAILNVRIKRRKTYFYTKVLKVQADK